MEMFSHSVPDNQAMSPACTLEFRSPLYGLNVFHCANHFKEAIYDITSGTSV